MNCPDVEELLGAFALDALPDSEARQVRAHVAGCAEHAEKARELRAVAARMPASVEPIAPPPELRGRVLAAIAMEPRDTRWPVSLPRARLNWRPYRNAFSVPSYALGAIAAAVLVAFGGLLAWNIALQVQDDEPSLARLASRATLVAPLEPQGVQGSGTVLYFAKERQAVLIADGLPQPGEGKTYQLWAIGGGRPVSLGVMRPDETGHMSGTVEVDASRVQTLAITVEPAGGSEQPTTEPVYTAEV